MGPPAHVILTAYNQLPMLRLSLRAYLRQTAPAFRLTVADDGSNDGTGAFVADCAAEATEHGVALDHVWQEDRGFRKNRILNEAVRRSRGPGLLIFSDADCLPPARFVERHLAVHAPWSFHVAGAVRLGREVSEGLTEADVDTGRFEGLGTVADERDLRRRARKSRWGVLLRRPNRPKVLGLNMAFDRRLLEAINGFDERFETWGIGEDTDVRDRAMRHRPRPVVRNLYTVNDVYHLWHPIPKGDRRGESRAYYATKRPVRCELGLMQAGST